MADHTAETIVAADPGTVFDYLADVSHLPEYLPTMTAAERIPGEDAVRTTAVVQPQDDGRSAGDGPREVTGEAWFRVDAEARRIAWGSEGSSGYHGEVRVEADGEGSRISLLVSSPHGSEGIDERLEESLAAIVDTVADGTEHI